MVTEWKHPRMDRCEYLLLITPSVEVVLNIGEKDEQTMGRPTRTREVYRVGCWAVEYSRADENAFLRLVTPALAEGQLELRFRATAVDVQIIAGGENRAFSGIASLMILPEGIVRITDTEPEQVIADHADTSGGNSSIEIGCFEQSIDKNDELEQAHRDLDRTQKELEQIQNDLKQTQQELDDYKRKQIVLEEATKARMEDLLRVLTSKHDELEAEIYTIVEQTENIQKENDRVQNEIIKAKRAASDAESELRDVQDQIEQAKGVKELRDLDCEAAAIELNELKAQLGADEDLLILMRQEPFLKGNSVRKAIESIRKELGTVESRLALIIEMREKINKGVQHAILIGDGSLPLASELEGGSYGNAGPASPTNS